MMRRACIAVGLTCALLIPAAAVAENPHQDAGGTWNYVPTVLSMDKEAGHQVFISGVTTDTFVDGGTFEGTGVQEFTLVHHAKKQFNFYRGVTQFTGTVDDNGTPREGTMTILTVGKQVPGLVYPSALPWDGTWRITAAAGGLEGLQGHGTFTGPSGSLVYEGTIHFT